MIHTSFRRLSIALLVAVSAGFSAAAKATPIQRVVSPGGIEAWLVQDATVPLIAMDFAFEGGSAQDPAGKFGLANLTSTALDEGAGDLDSSTFQERMARRAIEMRFSASRELIRGSLKTLKENRDEAFDLLRLALNAPRFDTEAVDRMRTQALSGLRRESVSPSTIGGRKFYETIFGEHPYAHSTSGTIEDVTSITPADMKNYVKRVFARNTLKVAVVGDIDATALGRLLDQTFGSLPAKAELADVAPIAAKPPGANERPVNLTLNVPQTTILFGGQGISRSDPDFMAAFVVNHILGGGQVTSRLYREVREKRGLAYSASNSLSWMKNAALLLGSTATRADRTEETVETLKSEIKRLAEEGPTAEELDEAKSYLKGSQMLALDTSTKIANALVQYQIDNLGIDYIARRNSLVDAVTPEAAKRVARRIWGQPLHFVVVGQATPTPAAAAAGAPTASAAN